MSSYVPRTKPYKHQDPAEVPQLKRMRAARAFALLMAMRTGKTKVILDEWGETEEARESQNLLVIAPAGCYRTWDGNGAGGEFATHMPDEFTERLRVAAWRSGSKRGLRAVQDLLAVRDDRIPRALLVNVEALSTVQKARDACVELLQSGPTTLVVDESTSIKNSRAARTDVVQELGLLARRRRIMTGLVSPRSPMDLYSQFYFLAPHILGFNSYYAFRNRYAVTKKSCFLPRRELEARLSKVPNLKTVPLERDDLISLLSEHHLIRRNEMIDQVVDYRNVEELHDKISPHSYRVRLEDCRDVPPKTYAFRDVRLTDEQERMYREMRDYATTLIEGTDSWMTAQVAVAQMMRLHRLLRGHATDEEGRVHEVRENFTAQLLELLDEHDGKSVIWCGYDAEVRKVSAAIEEAFGQGCVARFWGGNRRTREEEEHRFKTDDRCTHMVATPDAGGRGRTWNMATLMVFYSCRDNLEHRSQAEERAEGVEITMPCACVDMRAPGTVDDKIIKSMREKINMASVINGDNYREWVI